WRRKWSGSYLIMHLNLCLWSPAIPVPPRPPAPRPCFLPRPWVRLPRNLRVLETIGCLLDDHPLQEFVDRLPAVAEVAAVVVSALDPAVPFAGRRQANDGPQLPDVLQGRLAFRDRLAQVPDRLVLAVPLHERIVDRLVADLSPATEEEFCEDFRVNLSPCDVILDEMQHAADRGVLRDDRAVVLPCQMEHAQRVERRERVIHRRLRVALRESPRVGDAGETEHALRDVAHRQADALRRGFQDDLDRTAPSGDLERQRVGAHATALPGAAPPFDFDHVELRVVDRPPDRRSDLAPSGPPEPREAVLVPDDAGDDEVH